MRYVWGHLWPNKQICFTVTINMAAVNLRRSGPKPHYALAWSGRYFYCRHTQLPRFTSRGLIIPSLMLSPASHAQIPPSRSRRRQRTNSHPGSSHLSLGSLMSSPMHGTWKVYCMGPSVHKSHNLCYLLELTIRLFCTAHAGCLSQHNYVPVVWILHLEQDPTADAPLLLQGIKRRYHQN